MRGEAREHSKSLEQAWNRWEFAKANQDLAEMQKEEARILDIQRKAGHDNPEKYLQSAITTHTPGTFSGLSKKQAKEILKRSGKSGKGGGERQARIEEALRKKAA